jgi:hypothetical protein
VLCKRGQLLHRLRRNARVDDQQVGDTRDESNRDEITNSIEVKVTIQRGVLTPRIRVTTPSIEGEDHSDRQWPTEVSNFAQTPLNWSA